MTTFLAVIALGFFLGMRHATDPDHVIAVTTIVARQRSLRHAAWIGVLWGVGHTLTILLVGSAIILFSVVIPPRIGLTMELGVGLMLILLGVLNLSGIMRWITEVLTPMAYPEGESLSGAAAGLDQHALEEAPSHFHFHVHGDYVHAHLHGHGAAGHGHQEDATPQGWLDRTFGRLGLYHLLRPLVVGIVHGMAGSAAVALLVLAVIRNPMWSIAYLLVFGLGTIAGMMLITAAIAVPFAYTGKRFTRVNRTMAIASGVISLAFGFFIVYEIGFVQGLFTSHPHWTPQ